VFRASAAVLVVAVLSISVSATLQHVHEYADHDHAEHHHGPALHPHPVAEHHDRPGFRVSDRGSELEGCDPGDHAVSVVFLCASPEPLNPPIPVMSDAVVVAPPPEPAAIGVAPADVRAHSPPRLTDAPLRAPPLVNLA
jgi:hypothetical protein